LDNDERFHQEKIRIKNEEEKKQKEIEDRLRLLNISKDELEVIIYLIHTQSHFFFSLVSL
jgi:hypothetical protein